MFITYGENVRWVVGMAVPHHLHFSRLHKKIESPKRNTMFKVTYYNLWLKCYITFCDIVADGKRSSNALVSSIDNLSLFACVEKKLNQFYKSNFSMITLPFSSMHHFTLSPGLICKWFTISFGIPQRNELFWRFA